MAVRSRPRVPFVIIVSGTSSGFFRFPVKTWCVQKSGRFRDAPALPTIFVFRYNKPMRTLLLLLTLFVSSALALTNGTVAMTTGTAVRVSSTSQKCTGYVIQAASTNTAVIYFGPSTVTSSNGIKLVAGAAISWFPAGSAFIYDMNQIYLLGTTGDSAVYSCQ